MGQQDLKFIYWQISLIVVSSEKDLFILEFTQGKVGIANGKDAFGCDPHWLVLKPRSLRESKLCVCCAHQCQVWSN